MVAPDNSECYQDDESEISKSSYDHQYHEHHDAYGDGSHTTQQNGGAAFGGYGVWYSRWPGSPGELNLFGGTIGQVGSSTRQELTAWIVSLTQPIRTNYATDSAAMLSKATAIIEAVALRVMRGGKRAVRS